MLVLDLRRYFSGEDNTLISFFLNYYILLAILFLCETEEKGAEATQPASDPSRYSVSRHKVSFAPILQEFKPQEHELVN